MNSKIICDITIDSKSCVIEMPEKDVLDTIAERIAYYWHRQSNKGEKLDFSTIIENIDVKCHINDEWTQYDCAEHIEEITKKYNRMDEVFSYTEAEFDKIELFTLTELESEDPMEFHKRCHWCGRTGIKHYNGFCNSRCDDMLFEKTEIKQESCACYFQDLCPVCINYE